MEQLPLMVQGLYTADTAIQLQATAQFRKVLSKEKNPPIKEVISCGVVPRFVEFLRSPDSQIQVSPYNNTMKPQSVSQSFLFNFFVRTQ